MRPLTVYQKEQSIDSNRDPYISPIKQKRSMRNVINTHQLIQRFRKKLMKRSSNYFRLQKIPTFLEENYLKQLYYNAIEKNYLDQLLTWKTIDPSNIVIQCWDAFTTIFIFLIFILVPFQRAFDTQFFGQYVVEGSYLIFLCVDLVLKFNTAYLEEGNIIINRKKIMSNYFRNFFPMDILMVLSVFIDELIMGIIILIKFNNCLTTLLNRINLNLIQKEISNLIKLIVQITCFLHIIACFWYYVGDTTHYLGKSWIMSLSLQDEEPIVKYCYSYYWATISMVTVGYGDIVPKNYIEIVFCILISLLASGVFAFTINQIGQILNNLNKSHKQLDQSIRSINQYMNMHQTPQSLQNQIRNHLEHTNKQQVSEQSNRINNTIGSLSQQLKNELMYEVFKNIIVKCQLFKQFTEKSLKIMAQKIEQVQFSPGEIIFKNNDINDPSIYFIDQGTVQLIKENHIYKVISVGDSFGEYALFTNLERTCSAISLDFTKVYKINRQDCLISLNEGDFQKFHLIREKMIFREEVKGINCFACNAINHYMKDCPLVNYIPDKEALILKDKYHSINERKWLKRKDKFKTHNFYGNNQTIQKKQMQYMLSHRSDISYLTQSIVSQIYNEISVVSINKNERHLMEDQSRLSKRTSTINQPNLDIPLILDIGTNYNNYYPQSNMLLIIREYNKVRFFVNKKVPINAYHLIKHKNIKQCRKRMKSTYLIQQ